MCPEKTLENSMFHPDKQRPDVSEGEAEQHLQRFIDVDQAWKILSNEESRKEYNLQLQANELKQSWPVDACITLDDMNWDCDTECYTYSCRCGGEFILEKDDLKEMETVVCCVSCSLSIEVKKVTRHFWICSARFLLDYYLALLKWDIFYGHMVDFFFIFLFLNALLMVST